MIDRIMKQDGKAKFITHYSGLTQRGIRLISCSIVAQLERGGRVNTKKSDESSASVMISSANPSGVRYA